MTETEKKEEQVKVEEVNDSDSEGMPELEETEKDDQTPQDLPDLSQFGISKKQAKNEKKSRKAMAKVGMKPVQGIKRAVFKKTKTGKEEHIIFIQQPEVYKSTGGDVYIIFGDAKLEDISGMSSLANGGVENFEKLVGEDENPPDLVGGEQAKEYKVNESDIGIVKQSTNCTDDEARKALQETKGDIINAVLAVNKAKGKTEEGEKKEE